MMNQHNDSMTQKLKELREEYQRGQQTLLDLDNERNNVRDTLLRIAGAIQVLEELSEAGSPAASDSKTEIKSVAVAEAQ